MSEYIIETKDITKMFGKKTAVNNINMHVKKKEIYGFIGRNGAGKTTFLKIIANLISQSSGEIKLFGQTNLKDAHKKIGILIENPGLHTTLTAYENMYMKCQLLGIENPKQKIKELLTLVGLEKAKNKTKTFSLGMKQRLGIAMALVNDPELLLLDEPINGLDPQGIVEIREILLKLQNQGITIIISSHILEELGKICNRYGVISSGTLIKELTREEVEEISNKYIQIETNNIKETYRLLETYGIKQMSLEKDIIKIYDENIESALINEMLVKNGILVSTIYVNSESVEEVFISMMGEADYE
ncbi:ABC transporter ATP-binding protein [Mycoplasma sp. P36-A1]|uniref:ABC transporter ATP-binding protein n=1 Tax=Mycoplasma sp. P36-A1 TaxID=3252900 RepID=UPI003C2C1E9C